MKKIKKLLPYYIWHSIIASLIFLIILLISNIDAAFWSAITFYTVREIDDAFINGKGKRRIENGKFGFDLKGFLFPLTTTIILYFLNN